MDPGGVGEGLEIVEIGAGAVICAHAFSVEHEIARRSPACTRRPMLQRRSDGGLQIIPAVPGSGESRVQFSQTALLRGQRRLDERLLGAVVPYEPPLVRDLVEVCEKA